MVVNLCEGMGDSETAAATTERTSSADPTVVEHASIAAGEGAVIQVDQLKTAVEALVH